jgi:hypothetical protein
MRSIFMMMLLALGSVFVLACSSPSEKAGENAAKEAPAHGTPSTSTEAATPAATAVVRCEAHGVDQALCTRCDPRLEAVFQAKGDWCPEHSRPESQCVLCHPDLAALGVK